MKRLVEVAKENGKKAVEMVTVEANNEVMNALDMNDAQSYRKIVVAHLSRPTDVEET